MPLHIPERPGQPDHLVIGFHGHGGDEHAAAAYASLLDPVGAALVIAPRGPLATAGGAAWFATTEADGPVPPLRATLTAVDAAAREAAEARGIPASDATAFGFSQGAAVALSYALEPARTLGLGAVVALAAFLPHPDELPDDLEAPAGAPRIFLHHGRDDDRVPLALARAAARVLERNGWDVTFVEASGGHHVTVEALGAARSWLDRR